MFNILKNAAEAAAQIQLKYFRSTELDVSHKTDHQNIVTIADKESQDVIQKILIEAMKEKGVSESEVGFIGEEDPPSKSEGLMSEGNHIFVVDPIDGTSNFASGIDYFCTSIGYFQDGALQAGMIYRPTSDEMYFAEKGKGAQKIQNGQSLDLQTQKLDRKELMIFTEAWKDFGERQIDIANKLLPNYRGVRMNGAVALDIVLVAENICGLCIADEGPWIWDVAAAKIILEEAGGGIYDWTGKELTLDVSTRKKQHQILACHPEEKEALLKQIYSTIYES